MTRRTELINFFRQGRGPLLSLGLGRGLVGPNSLTPWSGLLARKGFLEVSNRSVSLGVPLGPNSWSTDCKCTRWEAQSWTFFELVLQVPFELIPDAHWPRKPWSYPDYSVGGSWISPKAWKRFKSAQTQQ